MNESPSPSEDSAKAQSSPLTQYIIAQSHEAPPVTLLQRPLSAQHSLPTVSTEADQPEGLRDDVDNSIVEALKSSKDRLYVLKLGETMETLIQQGKLYSKVELQPASSYQRLLVHRCAALYRLTPESSHSTISVIVTTESRMSVSAF